MVRCMKNLYFIEVAHKIGVLARCSTVYGVLFASREKKNYVKKEEEEDDDNVDVEEEGDERSKSTNCRHTQQRE